ncbi:hypothetical protein Hanom_Chr14g01333231 [Helianthus anomalus]
MLSKELSKLVTKGLECVVGGRIFLRRHGVNGNDSTKQYLLPRNAETQLTSKKCYTTSTCTLFDSWTQ